MLITEQLSKNLKHTFKRTPESLLLLKENFETVFNIKNISLLTNIKRFQMHLRVFRIGHNNILQYMLYYMCKWILKLTS